MSAFTLPGQSAGANQRQKRVSWTAYAHRDCHVISIEAEHLVRLFVLLDETMFPQACTVLVTISGSKWPTKKWRLAEGTGGM